eukprot:852822-Pyramimonas_sp.AAC.1
MLGRGARIRRADAIPTRPRAKPSAIASGSAAQWKTDRPSFHAVEPRLNCEKVCATAHRICVGRWG